MFGFKMIANLYRKLNLLSIDVALGAMCGSLFFAKLLDGNVPIVGIVCLGITVWIIYTVDHLMDARRIGPTASMERHRFHHKHYQLLLKLVILMVMINGVLTFFALENVWVGGIFLLIGVASYLLINRYIHLLKELLISILYTMGVLMPILMTKRFSLQEVPWIIVSQFGLVAFMNLLIFSWVDYEHDKKDGTVSFATKAGERLTKGVIGSVLFCVLTLFIFSPQVTASGLMVLMAILQFAIFWKKNRFLSLNRYRLIGEAIFMLPLLYYLI
jgi:4-hydroxybenzoate polyprenyltransferase